MIHKWWSSWLNPLCPAKGSTCRSDRVKRLMYGLWCWPPNPANIPNCGQIIAHIPMLPLSDLPWLAFSSFFPIPLRFFRVCERRLLAFVACTTCRWPMEGLRPTVWNWKLIHSSEYFKCDGIQYSGWWFQIWFSFTPIWLRFSFYKQTAQSQCPFAGLIE